MKSYLELICTCKLCKLEFRINLNYHIKGVGTGSHIDGYQCPNCTQKDIDFDIMRVSYPDTVSKKSQKLPPDLPVMPDLPDEDFEKYMNRKRTKEDIESLEEADKLYDKKCNCNGRHGKIAEEHEKMRKEGTLGDEVDI